MTDTKQRRLDETSGNGTITAFNSRMGIVFYSYQHQPAAQREEFMGTMEHLQANNVGILIAGVIALGLGVAQVVGFNSWTLDYRGLVTLFGWASLLKGIAILFVPGCMM